MNIATPWALKSSQLQDASKQPIHQFFQEHRQALRQAVRLLGGADAAVLVDELTDALTREPVASPRTMALLQELDDLLSLENVDDPDRVECGHFAEIDPSDPIVEEICLLTDGLHNALHAQRARACQDQSTVSQRRNLQSAATLPPAQVGAAQ